MGKSTPLATYPSCRKRQLSKQEEAFARACVLDPTGSAAAAARAAGYAEGTASRVQARRLLARQHVLDRIQELRGVGVDRLNRATTTAKQQCSKKPRAKKGEQPACAPVPAYAEASPAYAEPAYAAHSVSSTPPFPEPLPNGLIIDLDRVIREIALIGFANMTDFMQVDERGLAYVDLKTLTRDQVAAIKEITVEEFKDGRGKDAPTVLRIRIKLADKLPALLALGKHLGGFREKVRDKVEPDVPTDGPLAELIGMLRSIKRSALPVVPADGGHLSPVSSGAVSRHEGSAQRLSGGAHSGNNPRLWGRS